MKNHTGSGRCSRKVSKAVEMQVEKRNFELQCYTGTGQARCVPASSDKPLPAAPGHCSAVL